MITTLSPTIASAPRPRRIPSRTIRQRRRVASLFLAILPLVVGSATAAVFGNFNYTENPDGTTVTIDGCVISPVGTLMIPETIPVPGDPPVDKPVSSIKTQAFFNATGITEVIFPGGSTPISIGAFAFYSCTGLESVSLAGVASIGAGGFYFCTGLKSVSLAGLASIGDNAFRNCSNLKNVSIPSSVTTLGAGIFLSCGSLTAIDVDPANPNYSSMNGVLFNKAATTLITYPPGRAGGYAIPSGTTNIGVDAFNNCTKLTGVTVPASMNVLGNGSFYVCSKLSQLSFLGNAPTLGGSYVLVGVAPGFKLYVTAASSATFDLSPWDLYTKVIMGAPTPVTDWLLSHGFPTDTDLMSDSNGDGVCPLMACALNLNPNLNLSGSLPQPVFEPTQMEMTFYAGTSGITYEVEAGNAMQGWSTAGVTLSDPDENQMVTATVPVSGPKRFMRLKVSH